MRQSRTTSHKSARRLHHSEKPLGTPLATRAVPDGDLPRWVHTLNDGTRVLVRALRPADAELERAFICGLSPEARWFRFMGTINDPSDAMIQRLVDIDYVHDVALAALADINGTAREVGVARFSLAPDTQMCECAIAIADAWQQKGLAVILLRHLISIARARGITSMVSIEAASNQPMHQLAEFLGFVRVPDPDDPSVVVHRLAL